MNGRTSFDESEMQIIGEYPSCGGFFDKPQPPYPIYNRPISSKENFDLLINGKTPYWAPNLLSDFNLIQPQVMPDAKARSHGGTDWFGIQWQYEEMSGAPMVKPGTRRLSDLENWREELDWPDLSEIDWAKDAKDNYSMLPSDRPNLFLIVNGYFERLADLTSFEDTFCYLIEEPEEINDFFSRLDDWHIELARIAKDYYNTDIILLHDDMGTQRAPFFSTQMYVDLMQPHYQRFTKAVHDMGMHVAVHSCGCIGPHIPEFIKSGFEMWEGQDTANDMPLLMKEYGDKLGQIEWFHVPPNTSDEDAFKLIKSRIDTVGATGRYMNRLYDEPSRMFRSNEYMYKASRQKYDTLYEKRGF